MPDFNDSLEAEDGSQVVIYTLGDLTASAFPILGAWKDVNDLWHLTRWKKNGKNETDATKDLRNMLFRRAIYLNIYRAHAHDGGMKVEIFNSRGEADARERRDRLARIRVEVSEGTFDG